MKKIFFYPLIVLILITGAIGLFKGLENTDGSFAESMNARLVAQTELDYLTNNKQVHILPNSITLAKPIKGWMIDVSFLFDGNFNSLNSLMTSRGWNILPQESPNKSTFCKLNVWLMIKNTPIVLNNHELDSYHLNMQFKRCPYQS